MNSSGTSLFFQKYQFYLLMFCITVTRPFEKTALISLLDAVELAKY